MALARHGRPGEQSGVSRQGRCVVVYLQQGGVVPRVEHREDGSVGDVDIGDLVAIALAEIASVRERLELALADLDRIKASLAPEAERS